MKKFSFILFIFCFLLSCAVKQDEKNENEKNINSASDCFKPINLQDGQMAGGVFFVTNDSTQMHWIMWTGWRYGIIDTAKHFILNWVEMHPDAKFYPILKIAEKNKENIEILMSLLIDSTNEDTLQMQLIRNGMMYAGHFLPLMDSGFTNDTCFDNSKMYELLISCIDFKKYFKEVIKANDQLDSSNVLYREIIEKYKE